MISDVLHLEMLLSSRRRRRDVVRRAYAGWLMIQFAYLYLNYYASNVVSPVAFVDSYVQIFMFQQFLVILLGVPVFVAGSITEEKTRGTLQALMTADLSSASIVVGKLVAGVARSGRVLLAGLPIVCFLGPLVAFDAPRLAALGLATVAPLFAWSAAGILASVLSRDTRQAVIRLYCLAVAGALLPVGLDLMVSWLGAAPPPGNPGGELRAYLVSVEDALQYLDPRFVLAPAWGLHESSELGRRLLLSSLGYTILGVACTLLAIAQLRPAFRRQLGLPGRQRRAWLIFRPAVYDDPIRWKEQHVEGLAPVAALRAVPTAVGVVAVFAVTLYLCTRPGFGIFAFNQAGVVLACASVAVAIRSSGAISGEREHRSWEALLLTPLDVRQLIDSKVRGVTAATYPYLAAYAAPALAVPLATGEIGVAFVTALGLVATLVAIPFIGAAGVYCSVRAKNSWTALLATLAVGNAGGLAVVFLGIPVFGLLLLVLLLISIPFMACLSAALDFLGAGALLVVFPPVMNVFTYAVNEVEPATFDGDALARMGQSDLPQLAMVLLCVVGTAYVLRRLQSYLLLDAQRRAMKERIPYWKSGVNCGYATEQFLEQFGEPVRVLDQDGPAAAAGKAATAARTPEKIVK